MCLVSRRGSPSYGIPLGPGMCEDSGRCAGRTGVFAARAQGIPYPHAQHKKKFKCLDMPPIMGACTAA